MTSPAPDISVVLPVFNGGKFLNEAISSIRNQTFRSFELIILNDGSTDQSIEVIKMHAAADPRIVVVDRENKGLVATLNEGVRLAKADFIARMDADDICAPHRFAKQVEYFTCYPECVAVGSRVELIDPEGLPIRLMVDGLKHEEIDTLNLQGQGLAIAHPTVMFRREAALQVEGYRIDYKHAEDVDFFLRMAEVGILANLKDVLLQYRQHSNSVGYAHALAQMQSARAAARDALQRRRLPVPSVLNTKNDAIVGMPSDADIHRKWVWWSLSGGNRKTARKHVFKAICKEPLSLKNFRPLFCTLRGY